MLSTFQLYLPNIQVRRFMLDDLRAAFQLLASF